MVTVQQIYDMAIHLLDEQSEMDGSTMTTDNEEYKSRTISILNTVIPTLSVYSSMYLDWPRGHFDCCYDPSEPIRRPSDYAALALSSEADGYVTYDYKNPLFDQGVGLDDALAQALLPLYLAAQLVAEENPERSDRLMARYREVFHDMKNNIRGVFEPIRPPYGLF